MADLQSTIEKPIVKMKSLQKTLNVFLSPAGVFENIRMYPDWIFPLLVMIVISIVIAFSTHDLQYKLQTEAILNNELIPEETKDKVLEDLENKSPMRRNIETILGSTIAIGAAYVISAAALLVFGNFILGGVATFKQVFSMFSWGSMIGIVESLVKLPLMLSKGSLMVYTSLALLMDDAESKSIMFQILNLFDVFSIWKIIVLSIGFSVIYRFSKGKSYAAVITLYVIYGVIALGLSQLFQGFIN